MTILSAINGVCDVVSLDRFDTVFGNANPNAQTMIEFTQEAGEEIGRRGDWNRMLKTATVDGSPYPLPEDFQRLVNGGGIALVGGDFARPVMNAGEWSVIKTVPSSRTFFYMRDGRVEFSPVASNEGAVMNYVSKNWLLDGNDERATITSDDNKTLIPERLLTKGVIWRWRRQKGLSYEDQLAEFEADLAMELAADRGAGQ